MDLPPSLFQNFGPFTEPEAINSGTVKEEMSGAAVRNQEIRCQAQAGHEDGFKDETPSTADFLLRVESLFLFQQQRAIQRQKKEEQAKAAGLDPVDLDLDIVSDADSPVNSYSPFDCIPPINIFSPRPKNSIYNNFLSVSRAAKVMSLEARFTMSPISLTSTALTSRSSLTSSSTIDLTGEQIQVPNPDAAALPVSVPPPPQANNIIPTEPIDAEVKVKCESEEVQVDLESAYKNPELFWNSNGTKYHSRKKLKLEDQSPTTTTTFPLKSNCMMNLNQNVRANDSKLIKVKVKQPPTPVSVPDNKLQGGAEFQLQPVSAVSASPLQDRQGHSQGQEGERVGVHLVRIERKDDNNNGIYCFKTNSGQLLLKCKGQSISGTKVSGAEAGSPQSQPVNCVSEPSSQSQNSNSTLQTLGSPVQNRSNSQSPGENSGSSSSTGSGNLPAILRCRKKPESKSSTTTGPCKMKNCPSNTRPSSASALEAQPVKKIQPTSRSGGGKRKQIQ